MQQKAQDEGSRHTPGTEGAFHREGSVGGRPLTSSNCCAFFAPCAAPQNGLQPVTMALITSDCDAMSYPSIKWP